MMKKILLLLGLIGYSLLSLAQSPSEEVYTAESEATFYHIYKKSSFTGESIPKYYKIGSSQKTTVIASMPQKVEVKQEEKSSPEVSFSVPVTGIKNEHAFALIIGNEDYKSFQTGLSSEQNVDFALNDAKLVKEIFHKTMGIPDENIIFLENAGFVAIKQAITQIQMIGKYSTQKPEIYVYYSGHGLPDEQTKIPYLIPVDVAGTALEYAISLPELYKNLSSFPTEKVVVILDACFTGESRNAGLVTSRGVRIKPKADVLQGNMIIFSASSADQPSKAYKDKKHGLFTYFLSQKLIESKGQLTLGELDKYLVENVPIKSILVNKTEQVPTTNVSPEIDHNWRSWGF